MQQDLDIDTLTSWFESLRRAITLLAYDSARVPKKLRAAPDATLVLNLLRDVEAVVRELAEENILSREE
jgi:hypothetical protein